jgi:hypothetical protein
MTNKKYIIDLLNFNESEMKQHGFWKKCIGKLHVRSGEIVACDPLVNPERMY